LSAAIKVRGSVRSAAAGAAAVTASLDKLPLFGGGMDSEALAYESVGLPPVWRP
jgi:hypothetical protein